MDGGIIVQNRTYDMETFKYITFLKSPIYLEKDLF